MKKYLVLCLIFIFMILTGCGANNKGPFTFRTEDGITVVYSGDKPAHGKVARVDHNGYSYNFNVKKGLYDGKYECYYRSGNLYTTMIYKNGKREGILKEYYETGDLSSQTNYKNGELDGEHEEYYKNGQIKIKANYQNDKREGILEEYYENGQIKIKANYKNGELNGEHEEYYKNRQIKIKANYQNDKLNGTKETYEDDGELKSKNNYENGELHGEQYLKKYGGYIEEATYEHGKIIKNKLSLDKDSKRDNLDMLVYQKDRRRSVSMLTTYYESENKKEEIYYDKNNVMTHRKDYKDEKYSSHTLKTFDVNGNVLSSW